jgi:hypothetical protein
MVFESGGRGAERQIKKPLFPKAPRSEQFLGSCARQSHPCLAGGSNANFWHVNYADDQPLTTSPSAALRLRRALVGMSIAPTTLRGFRIFVTYKNI